MLATHKHEMLTLSSTDACDRIQLCIPLHEWYRAAFTPSGAPV